VIIVIGTLTPAGTRSGISSSSDEDMFQSLKYTHGWRKYLHLSPAKNLCHVEHKSA
jgi:hypothetical protein